MSEIAPFMYLSGLYPAQTLSCLKEHKITHVLNLVGDLMPEPLDATLKNLIFCAKDSETEQLSDLFLYCFEFIQDARQ